MSVRILLADDHDLIRQALSCTLEQEFDFDVVGEASDGHCAVQQAAELQPDVVVMDIHMPVLNGIDATRMIRARCENTKVVALSMYRDQQHVTGMFRAGAHGYVLKQSALEELHTAIRTVLTGRSYVSPDIANLLLEDYMRHLDNDTAVHEEVLTEKERQVLQLISEGHSTREIAALLFVSVSTIETHRQRIMNKLHVSSVAQLTKSAIRLGLTEA
jgi:DNA-binding NarL/FixJ family response regulator